MKHYAKIIENNAGGLTLYIMDESDKCVFAHSGYEYVAGQLSDDIKALLANDSCADWDGHEPEIADEWDALEYGNQGKFTGLELVAETNDSGLHTYPNRMGGAARKEFGVTDDE